MSRRKPTDYVIQQCDLLGIKVVTAERGKRHYKVRLEHADRKMILVVSSTDSDHRAQLATRARLRRFADGR